MSFVVESNQTEDGKMNTKSDQIEATMKQIEATTPRKPGQKIKKIGQNTLPAVVRCATSRHRHALAGDALRHHVVSHTG
jgi:hypothetical protein